MEQSIPTLLSHKPQSRLHVVLSVLLWGVCSAVIVAYFFFSSFFPEYSPFVFGDAGFAILVVPAFCGFVMGVMMNEHDIKITIYGCLSLTLISLLFIFFILFLPLIVGTISDMSQLGSSDQERQAAVVMSVLFILPISLIGGVMGKSFGHAYLPSEEEKALRRLLILDTRKWHKMLRDYVDEKAQKDSEQVTEDEPEKEDEPPPQE